MENEENPITFSQNELLGKLKEISCLMPYCEKPNEGWIISLGAALGFDHSQLSQKLNMSIKKIQYFERRIRVPVGFNKAGKAFGGRFQYIFIPKNMDDVISQEVGKRFKKLSLLPQKPEEGWLKAIRSAWGISPIELAQRINCSSSSSVYLLETTEKNGRICPKYLESILQTMNCRAELVFIPEELNFIQNAFTSKKFRTAKKLLITSSLRKRPLFPAQFEQLALLPKRSTGSNIQMLRKVYGLTQKALAKKMGCNFQGIAAVESGERGKKVGRKVPYPPLEKIAHALGCHLNYLFVPNKDSPHYPNLDEDFGKEYELTFQMAQQTPSEGWISNLRKALQVSREDLAKRSGVDISQIDIFESNEKNNELISPILKEIAQALDCQVRLMFIPEKAFFDELSPSYHRRFEKIYSSLRKPSGGWIRFIRTIRRMKQKQLAQTIKAKNRQITSLEGCEAKKSLIHKDLQKMAHALRGRFEYVFIPNTPLSYPFPKKHFYQDSSPPLKPAAGWINAIRLARGISVRELAAMAHVSCRQVYRSERFESQNIFSSYYFQKIAEALGGRFEYVLIPDKEPLPRNRSLVPTPSFLDHPQY